MYAIIKAGGKQYTVKPGDVLRVEKMEAELGAQLEMKDLLMVGGEKTFVGGDLGKALVTVVVTNQERGPKLVVFKKKRRQGYRRMGGHRQPYTELFVVSITSPEGTVTKAEGKAHVYDPKKKAAKIAKLAEVREGWKQAKRAAQKSGSEGVVHRKVATGQKKYTTTMMNLAPAAANAKPAAKKVAGTKAKAAKKPATKTAAKKTAKKTAKKKTK
jgi:large subunit ribosomal protein L21